METNLERRLSGVTVNIRSRRNLLNYSQEYMGIKLNISQNAYSKIELDQTNLSVRRLYEIADILNVTPAELMDVVVA
jgi:transcriptional regulator with XRE-family HTH domain